MASQDAKVFSQLFSVDSNIYSRQSWCNLLAFILICAVTYANNGYGYGKSVTEISDEYPTIITPPGWAFAIWGIIFTLEGIFSVWQLCQSQNNRVLSEVVGPWWICACLFQTAWNFIAAGELFIIAAFALGGISSCLAVMCLQGADAKMTVAEYILVKVTFGIHAGWTCIATFLSFNVVAVARDVSSHGQLALAIVSLALVLVIGIFVGVVKRNVAYSLALGWGVFAISQNQNQTKLLLGDDIASRVEYSSIFLALFLVLPALGFELARACKMVRRGVNDTFTEKLLSDQEDL
mmetsp:Transcript_11045/g.17144  ORF Transcript_11045/g.17144 Transcript_11045/m.17144 type:complete len:293 (-) Transcript_11045:386-1264(-)